MSQLPQVELGAQVVPGGVCFACFTQAARCAVELVAEDGSVLAQHELSPLGQGYFQLLVPHVEVGTLYFWVIDERRLPDPYARRLPQGVHGPAQIVSHSYHFQNAAPVRPLAQQVIYELHVGTFSDAGTFDGARHRLPELAELGVTCIELMPVAAFAGRHGWGYDGVALYAPHAPYGTPDELQRFVDEAHGLGMSVILDVVYNHFGPSGNYLSAFSSTYFSQDAHSAWGQAPNFAEPALRQLVLNNACYWLTEYGFDGLRLDATHALIDPSPKHILAELAELAHGLTPRRFVIAEDERNLAGLVTEQGLDAVWADDFHHQLRVTLTGERAGYYAAYEPSAQGLADAINRGWLYTGQASPLTGEARGTPTHALPAEALVYCIQNHDQIGNRALGDRLAHGDAYLGASALLLFLPMTPLLFMGQEWAASTPFLYFTDHDPELGKLVTEGRRREFAAFVESVKDVPDPQAAATFAASQLRWSEREQPEHARTLALYREALSLRRTDAVLSGSGREQLRAEAWNDVLVVRRALGTQERVLVMNLGSAELVLASLHDRLQLRAPRVLLTTAPGDAARLRPGAALIFAGESNVVGLSEGQS
jgi:maltooligosyltrehalose trehalohydrolase